MLFLIGLTLLLVVSYFSLSCVFEELNSLLGAKIQDRTRPLSDPNTKTAWGDQMSMSKKPLTISGSALLVCMLLISVEIPGPLVAKLGGALILLAVLVFSFSYRNSEFFEGFMGKVKEYLSTNKK